MAGWYLVVSGSVGSSVLGYTLRIMVGIGFSPLPADIGRLLTFSTLPKLGLVREGLKKLISQNFSRRERVVPLSGKFRENN